MSAVCVPFCVDCKNVALLLPLENFQANDVQYSHYILKLRVYRLYVVNIVNHFVKIKKTPNILHNQIEVIEIERQ